jgi:hypothetical protein
LFTNFYILKPFISFSLPLNSPANGYRTISLKTLNLKVNGLNPYADVEIRLYKLNSDLSQLRFWKNNALLDIQVAKNPLLKGIHF